MTVWTVPATVVSIHDGDTITVDLDLGWHIQLRDKPLRLAGCNAPELATDAGIAAVDYLETLLAPGDQVTVVSHSLDKYGRILGAVELINGTDLAAVMIAAGHAVKWDGHGPKPVPLA